MPWTPFVNFAGDQLLSRATFAFDQHRETRSCHADDARTQFVHDPALAYHHRHPFSAMRNQLRCHTALPRLLRRLSWSPPSRG